MNASQSLKINQAEIARLEAALAVAETKPGTEKAVLASRLNHALLLRDRLEAIVISDEERQITGAA